MKTLGRWLNRNAAVRTLALLLMLLGVGKDLAAGQGAFQPNLLMGAAGYTIPIETPPGTNGVGPKLSLTYSSGGGNDWIGTGWSLEGLGSIERMGSNYNPVPSYGSTDTYILNFGSGGKLVFGSDGYYHTQTESFLRIQYVSASNYWLVTDKNGIKYYFGVSAASQQNNPGFPAQVFSWKLDKVLYPHGLFWTVTYDKDEVNGDIYPKQIVYTQGAGLAAFRTVDFILRYPSEMFTSYRSGGKIVNDRLLLGIEIKMSGQLVRKYTLDYWWSGSTQRAYAQSNVLHSITETGADGAASLPATIFTYNYDANGGSLVLFETVMTDDPAEGLGGQLVNPPTASNCTFTIDMNSDALSDVLVGQAGNWYYYPNLGTGGFGARVNIPNTATPFPALCSQSVEFRRDTVTTTQIIFVPQRDLVTSYHTYWKWQPGFIGINFDLGQVYLNVTGTVSREIIHSVHDTAVVDLDSDGFPDILYSSGVGQWYWWRGVGNGQFAERASIVNGPSSIQLNDPTIRLVDIDADGLTDIVQFVKVDDVADPNDSTSGWYLQVFRNLGKDQSGTSSFAPVVTTSTYTLHHVVPDNAPFSLGGVSSSSVTPMEASDLAMIDMNGDGLPDLVWTAAVPTYYPYPHYAYVVYYFPNQGFQSSTVFGPRVKLDGLSNRGLELDSTSINKLAEYVRFVDMNGDGLPDIFVGTGTQSKGGYYFFYYPLYSPSYGYSDRVAFDIGDISGRYPGFFVRRQWNYATLADMNGDGSPDVVSGWPGNYRYYALDTSDSHQLLDTVQTPLGGKLTLAYQRLRDAGTIRWVASAATAADGLGLSATTNYSYSGAKHVGWPQNEFRGYANATAYDPPDHNGLRHYTATGFHQDDAKKGKVAVVNAMHSNGSTISRTTYDYAASTVQGVSRVDLSSQIVDTYESTPTPKTARTDYANYDQYGNARQTTISGTGIAPRLTTTDFVYNTAAYIVSRPSHTAITSNGTKISEAWFDYDSQVNGAAPTVGNLTKETHWLSGETNTAVQYFYNTMGNPIGNIDAKGNSCATTGYTNRIIYDAAYQTFPVSETNALCQTTAKTYWGVNTGLVASAVSGAYATPGLLATVTDLNGVRRDSYWDSFGRPKASVLPPDSASFPSTVWNYTLSGTAPSATFESVRETTGGGTVDKIAYVNGFGGAIQTKNEAETAGQWVTQDTWYNLRGLAESVTIPYISYSNGYTPRDTAKRKTTTLYDVMRRPIKVTNPDGNYRTTAYGPYVVADTDEKFFTTTHSYDALNRLINVVEPTGSITAYSYDNYGATGHNTQTITDAAGNVSTTVLDTLGRKTVQAAPDLGVWIYAYDANGNLLAQRDAKKQAITFAYDKLNRVTSKNYPTGTPVRYFYDDTTTGTYRQGRLGGITDTSGSTTLTYDARGNLAQTDKVVDGGAYNTKASYDSLGRVVNLVYPDGEVVHHTYNAQGVLEKLSSSLPDPGVPGPPTVTGFWPRSGSANTMVFAFGSGFIPNQTQVRVNGINTTFVQVVSPDLLIFLLPAGNTNGPIQVTTAQGQVNSLTAFGAALSGTRISGIWPTQGKAGTVVFIFGSGFIPTQTQVSFNLTRASLVHTLDTSLTVAFVPKGTTTGPVKVSTAQGSALSTIPFTISGSTTPPSTGTYPLDYIANLDYNEANQITSKTMGNGKVTSYTYNANTFRLISLTTPGLQALSYGFDPAGNVAIITDSVKANTQTFGYDNLHRLTSAAGPSAPIYNHGYAYDVLGNITSGAGKTYTYPAAGSPRPHAVTGDGTCTYGYDANGNMATRVCGATTRSFTWDYDNRLIQVKNGSTVLAAFTYDHTGQRVKKIEGSNTTVIPFPHYRSVNGVNTKYYSVNGQRIAERDNANYVYYYHADHLRSSNTVSNSAGAEVKSTLFFPYGATRIETGTKSVAHKYTGQEHDTSTGLYYYGARYYDPGAMRFISADSVIPNVADPQMLNRYLYARGNPVKYIDPTGNSPLNVTGAIYGGFSGFISGAITGWNAVNPSAGFWWQTGGAVIGATSGGLAGAGIGALLQPEMASVLSIQVAGGTVGGLLGNMGSTTGMQALNDKPLDPFAGMGWETTGNILAGAAAGGAAVGGLRLWFGLVDSSLAAVGAPLLAMPSMFAESVAAGVGSGWGEVLATPSLATSPTFSFESDYGSTLDFGGGLDYGAGDASFDWDYGGDYGIGSDWDYGWDY